MISHPENKWIGVEYFCSETDMFWQLSDKEIVDKAIGEMESIGVYEAHEVKDSVVVRIKKALSLLLWEL